MTTARYNAFHETTTTADASRAKSSAGDRIRSLDRGSHLTASRHTRDISLKNKETPAAFFFPSLLLLLLIITTFSLPARSRLAPILILFYRNSPAAVWQCASRAGFLNVIIQAPGVASDRYGWRSRYIFG